MSRPTPLDRTTLTSRSFGVVRRGFAPAEVLAHLHELADRLEVPPPSVEDDPRPAAAEEAHRLVAEARRAADAERAAQADAVRPEVAEAEVLVSWLVESGAAPDRTRAFERSPAAWASEIRRRATAMGEAIVGEAQAAHGVDPTLSDARGAHEAALLEVAEAQADAMLAQARQRATELERQAEAEAEAEVAGAQADADSLRSAAERDDRGRRSEADTAFTQARTDHAEARQRADAVVAQAAATADRARARARSHARTSAVEALARARHDLEALQRDEHATLVVLRRVHDLVSQTLPASGGDAAPRPLERGA